MTRPKPFLQPAMQRVAEEYTRRIEEQMVQIFNGSVTGRMRINHPNMEQRERPTRAIPILDPAYGPVYDITSLPAPNEPAGEPTHICCCDPGRALCGADTTGQEVKAVHPKDGANPCVRCVEMDLRGAKCAEPKCPGPGPVGA